MPVKGKSFLTQTFTHCELQNCYNEIKFAKFMLFFSLF